MDDIFEVARRAVGRGIIERYFRTEKAYWNKDEYFTLNPLRHDKTIGSFHIKADGRFIDHASQDSGDFMALVSKAYGLSLKETAEKIIQDTGGIVEERKPVHEVKKSDALYPIAEFDKKRFLKYIQQDWIIKERGKYIESYQYKNEKGELLFLVSRFETEDSKNLIPVYLKKDGNFGQGRIKELQPYPLYMGYKVLKNNDTIVIVEGEKCANVKIEGYNLVTWMGGTSNVKYADWKFLKNLSDRKIIIWPDADEVGKEAGLYIKNQIPHSELIDVSDMPDKWDIADAEKAGEDLIVFIECHNRVIIEEPKQEQKHTKQKKDICFDLTPYDVFKRYITEVFQDSNLHQFSCTFWKYRESKHHWSIEPKDDIKNHMVRWMERIDIIGELKLAEKTIHTFITNTANCLERYSQDVEVENNPFLDTAIKPYVFYNNGAVEIKDDNKIFYDRIEKGEDFFKNLFPIHCLEFDFSKENYENTNIKETAPAFYFYAIDLIPAKYKEIESEKEKTIQLFSQILAYSIIPIKKTEYVFGFYGLQNSGKSFFIEILKEFIGGDFIVSRPVGDMENNFASSQLWGSKIYVDDDFKAGEKLPDSFLKKYAGDKTTTIEFKNQKPINGVKMSIAMFFLSNHNFKVTSSPDGMDRRLIYVPFKRTLTEDELDRTLLSKIIGKHPKGEESGKFQGMTFDERPALLALALQGFDLLNENNFIFTLPEWVRVEKEKWLKESNTVNEFLHDEFFSDNKELRTKGKDLHKMYKIWCEEEDRKPLGKNNFLDECMKHKNIQDYNNGKERYIFINKIKTDQEIEDEQIPI